jgi:hypothetical protein
MISQDDIDAFARQIDRRIPAQPSAAAGNDGDFRWNAGSGHSFTPGRMGTPQSRGFRSGEKAKRPVQTGI